jgi:ATP-dependent DNA helicase RecG
LTENNEGKPQKPLNLTENVFPTMIVKNVYEAIKMNRKAKDSWLQDNLGVIESTVQRPIDDLKKLGYISSEHSKIKGEWQLLKLYH